MRKLITIAGGSASGKTSLANDLCITLQNTGIKTLLCSQDDYTICPNKDLKSTIPISEYDFDKPYAIDTKHLFSDVTKILNGKSVYMPKYYFGKKDKEYKVQNSGKPEIIILEGTFVLFYSYLNQIKYKSLFVNVDEETRLDRRLKRDFLERNISKDKVIERFNKFVKPSHDNYIQPSIINADIVVSNEYNILDIINDLNIF